MLQLVRESISQSNCGSWRATQGAPRTAGAADEGMRNRWVCNPVVARDDEGEGLRPVWHTGLPSRFRIVLGLGSTLMGICASLERFSSMKQLLAPELTRNASRRESWP